MRRLIITLTIIIAALSAQAQWTYPIGTPTWYKKVRVDSVFWLNTVDTIHSYATLYPGALMARTTGGDTSLYMANGTRWVRIGSASAGGGTIDSAYRSNDTLFFRYASGGELAVKMDYYTKTESDGRYIHNSTDPQDADFNITGGGRLGGNLGVGTVIAPSSAKIYSVSTSIPQLRTEYSTGNRMDVQTVSTGTTTFTLAGTSPKFVFNNNMQLTSIPVLGTAATNFLTSDDGVISSRTADQALSDINAISNNEKGAANGVATLDASNKIPLNQIPESLLGAVNYQGTYDADIDTPSLPAASSSNKGWYYIVNVAGTQMGLPLDTGDWVISNGSSWGKVDNSHSVTSVFGRTGAVTAQNGDYTTDQVTEGSNLYFTNARARSALSAGTGISYNSGTGVITNSAPDQVVGLAAGTGISVSGTYPNFTVTNTGVTNTPNLQQVTDIGATTTNTIRAAAFQSTIDPGSAGYSFMNAGATLRWIVRGINAEGGSNSGYDIAFNRRNDAGASIGDALTLIRSNGNAIFGAGVSIGSTSPDLSNSRFYLNADAGQIIRNPGGPSLSGGGRLRLMQSGLPDQADYPLGRILFDGDGNTSGTGLINPKLGAQIAAQSDAAWVDLSSYPTRLSFYTNTGTTNTSETMRLSSIGWLAVGSEISSNYGIAAPFVVSYDGAQFDVSPTLSSDIVTFNSRNSATGDLIRTTFNASEFRVTSGTTDVGAFGIGRFPASGLYFDCAGPGNFDGSLTIGAGAASITGLGNATFTALNVNGNTTFAGNGTPGAGKVPTGTDAAGNWTWQAPGTGAVVRSITSVQTGDYTVGASDYTVLLNPSSSGLTVTIPAASSANGRVLVLRNLSTNSMTISQTIVGYSGNFTLLPNGTSYTIQSNGTNWYQLTN